MMASLPDTTASPGTTTVTAPSSKKPCVRQGFNVLICTVLVAMTYLSIHSDVISVTPNIAQDVSLPAASDDTGRSEIDDVAILPKSVMSEPTVDDVAILPKPARSKINDVAVLPTSVMSEIGGFKRKPGGPCQEKTRLAYIKVHKAGSTTVLYIFQRFGYRRHLHFVLPSRRDVNIGWPYLMKKEDYLQPIPGRPFDLLVDHTVYNREIFRNLLPNNTVYLTIVREPYSHLQSVINFFRLTGRYGMPKDDPGKFFLRSPAELERTYFQSDENKRTPFSKTRNFMAYDLGIPVALSEDEDYVRDYVAELDRDFLLVMVLEYFDESLVLLKRYMCWQLTDILYEVQNSRDYTNKGTDRLSQKLRDAHKNWSKADYMLYQHFNRTLWEKVANEGSDFYSEVKQFKYLNRVTSQFCIRQGKGDASRQKVLKATAWNKRFVVDINFCRLLNMKAPEYRKALKERYCQDVKTTIPASRHMELCTRFKGRLSV